MKKRGLDRSLLVAILATVTFGCANGVPDGTGGSVQALRREGDGDAVAAAFAERSNLPHGIAAGDGVVFVAEPFNGRVAVLDRATGAEVGELPPPPGGFLLPFALRVPREGRVVVLDPGGFPSPTTPAIARVYDYDYSSRTDTHGFDASLARSTIFTGLPVVFAEDVEVLPDGVELVSESIIGAIWVIGIDGTISPGLFPDSFAPGEGIPALSPCFLPDTTIDGVPFHTAGNFGPGIVALASHRGQVYFSSTCQGGVFRIPVASLTDPTRTPDQRAADIAVVSPRPAGQVEAFEGLAFNRFDPDDDQLYAADSFRLAVTAIDIDTGARQMLVQDDALLNFPAALQFAPPGRDCGHSTLFVASDQEYRIAALNAALTENLLEPPFTLAQIRIGDH